MSTMTEKFCQTENMLVDIFTHLAHFTDASETKSKQI